MKGFDVATDTKGRAHDIKALGYGAVGIYLRFDRTSLKMVQGLHELGIKVFSIYELGHPTSPEYFTALAGHHDGTVAVLTAKTLGQPKNTPIFTAFDYDASAHDMTWGLKDYMAAFRKECLNAGYLAGCYGSGQICEYYTQQGLTRYTFLAQSKGWAMYDHWLPKASIVQGQTTTVLGFDVDEVEVNDQSVLW